MTTTTNRVTFTSTGATGVVVARYVIDEPDLGDLAGDWATVRFDDGEIICVRADDLTPDEAPELTCCQCGNALGILPGNRARPYVTEHVDGTERYRCLNRGACKRAQLAAPPRRPVLTLITTLAEDT
jgi:hypothetical protein